MPRDKGKIQQFFKLPVPIGELVKQEVQRRRMMHKEFGALIGKNEKTMPDIFDRTDMSIDLLVSISCALKKDFFKYYYDHCEELNKLRDDEVATCKNENTILQGKIETLQEELADLKGQLHLINKILELPLEKLLILRQRSSLVNSIPIVEPTDKLTDTGENKQG